MNHWLELICMRCDQKYLVKYIKSRPTLDIRIDFALCPCGWPRNKALHDQYAGKWKCKECHVPDFYAKKKTNDLCESCYFEHYRKKQVAKKNEMLELNQ